MPFVLPGWVDIVLWNVNQVLVRLWARHQQVLVHGFGRSIRF